MFLAASPLADKIGGRYFEDVNESPVVQARPDGWGAPAVAGYALDQANASRLWDLASGIIS